MNMRQSNKMRDAGGETRDDKPGVLSLFFSFLNTVFLLTLLLLAAFAPRAEAAGYQLMPITFSGYNKPETLTNFPVLVVLSNNVGGSGFGFSNFVTTSGYDLRFVTSSTSTNWLNYEIESWDTNSASYVWVQVPLIASDGTTTIYAKWGASDNSAQLPCTTNGAVWTNGYVAVWHMTQTNAQDSTTNRYNGVSTNNVSTNAYVGTGQSFSSGNTLDFPGPTWQTNVFSVSYWFRNDNLANYSPGISSGNGWNAFQSHGGAGDGKSYAGITGVDPGGRFTENTYWATAIWTYFTFTDNNNACSVYKNGGVLESRTLSAPTTNWGGFYIHGAVGVADEVRISSVARSANWVWAEYQTMASNTTFTTCGRARAVSPGMTYKLPMAFTNYTRAETLTNFPVLVTLARGLGGLFEYNSQFTDPANGGDLRFGDSTETTNLDFEIESWNNTGASYVWVRVPLLTSNTTIYAKWGGSNTNLPACTTNGAVWTNGYVAVWHMTQTNAQDSTTNRYNGVSTNNVSAAAYVGTGQSFGPATNLTFSGLTWQPNIFTVSYWLRPNTLVDYNQVIGAVNWSGAWYSHSESGGRCYSGISDSSRFTQASYWTAGNWTYFTFTDNANACSLLRDGVVLASMTQIAPTLTWGGFRIGNTALSVNGIVDEMRISSVARSTNWVWAEYQNMANNTSFNGYGAVEKQAAPPKGTVFMMR